MGKVIVKKSHIHGTGVFAACDIKKGEVITKWKIEKMLTEKEAKTLPESTKRYLSYIGEGRWIILQSPERYINHSCNPNIFVKNQQEIAKRDIKQSEEITSDYSLEGVVNWKFKCSCGARNCRKVIYGDFNKLDKKTQKKLEPYLQDWYKKEILKRC